MENNYLVYVHTNKVNGKKYIGQTCKQPNERWRNGNGYYASSYFFHAIQKYGWDNFEHEILFENLSLQEANEIETNLIAEYKTTDSKYGYNIRVGGSRGKIAPENKWRFCGENHPFFGKKHTLETREKLSVSHQGKKLSEETKKKMSVSRMGRVCSDKTREKLRNSLLGRAGTNIGKDAHNAVSICQYDRTGNFIKEYSYMREAEKETGINASNICACAKGRLKTAGGYIWRYKE